MPVSEQDAEEMIRLISKTFRASSDDIDDMKQAARIRAWRCRTRTPDASVPYTAQTIRNAMRDESRKQVSGSTHLWGQTAPYWSSEGPVLATGPVTGPVMDQHEYRGPSCVSPDAFIQLAILEKSLPKSYMAAIIATFVHDTMESAAQSLSLTVPAYKATLSRARAKARELVGGAYE